jgi:hypothetical protein
VGSDSVRALAFIFQADMLSVSFKHISLNLTNIGAEMSEDVLSPSPATASFFTGTRWVVLDLT